MTDSLALGVVKTGRGEIRYVVEGMSVDRSDLLAWLQTQRETGRFDDCTMMQLSTGRTIGLDVLEDILGASA